MFEKNWPANGYRISKSKTGFVVSYWSNVQGKRDGDKYLYPFDKNFTPETDLHAPWNEILSYGDHLGGIVRGIYQNDKEYGRSSHVKCLARGEVVLLGDMTREDFHAWMNPENNTPEALAAVLATLWPEVNEAGKAEILKFLQQEALSELTL